MELLVNDLSMNGQFPNLDSFKIAIARIMAIRQIAHQFGRELHCHRSTAHAKVTPLMTMPQAVQILPIDERRILMHWLTQNGPFWEDFRNHGVDDWLEWNGTIVTDTAVGEAAWCSLNGIDRALVSFTPSSWLFSPVPVQWVPDSGNSKSVDVENYWELQRLMDALHSAPVPLSSWTQLEKLVRARCTHLQIAPGAFSPMIGHPFGPSPAQRILFLLDKLNQLKSCFDENGQRTTEGHEIYQDFFTGKKGKGGRGPLFTDSSDDEKNRFQSDMTFQNPSDLSKTLFCSWHGKVQTPQLRVHFTYPIQADEILNIVYVGPKITKR